MNTGSDGNSANGNGVSKEERDELAAYLVEALVGSPDPVKLAQALSYASVNEMLEDRRVAALPDLFFQGNYLSNMTRLRVDLERERLGYKRGH